jgi:hypothetical protein
MTMHLLHLLLNALRRRFGLRVQRWPMAVFNRRPLPETPHFRLVKRDGFIFIEPKGQA